MTESITARVTRGAHWLDQVRPGWWERLDLGDLDMRWTTKCVGAQAFSVDHVVIRTHGTYHYGRNGGPAFWDTVDALTPNQGESPLDAAERHGLYLLSDDRGGYQALRLEWVALVTARREAVQPN